MLILRDVRKAYGKTVAVDGLSLRVEAGEVFGLLGPNGAGKTTTISMAIGLVRPDAGSVELEGHGPPTDGNVRRLIGVAPQSLALYDQLTAEENLEFFGRLYDLRGKRLVERVHAVLDAVGLLPRRRDRVGAFSGGMKRRMNLAVAMLHDPPMLLLDEPTAGVDPQSRNNILELVRSLGAQGRTVVYTTHYMEEAQRLCDRVAVMDQGRLMALGTVHELVERHGGRSVVTFERGEQIEHVQTDDPLRAISGALSGHAPGPAISGVRIERPSLESVFLTLTGRSLRD
ncbi:MAG: ABC transporter ATP-binding protein [Phycisphaeraceae bacterium]|nr:ABC transporter ATP-binding protein [Phycisphaeraceae bacterium]